MSNNETANTWLEIHKILFSDINGILKLNPLGKGSVEEKRLNELFDFLDNLRRKQRIIERSGDTSANRMLVKDFIFDDFGDFVRFVRVPAKIAKSLPVGYGYVDLEEKENGSPTMREMIELATMYNGMIEGYVIPLSDKSGNDPKITFDNLILPISADVAAKLNEELKPHGFRVEEDGTYRLWWS